MTNNRINITNITSKQVADETGGRLHLSLTGTVGPVPLFREYIRERGSKSSKDIGIAEYRTHHVPPETQRMADRLFTGIRHTGSRNTAFHFAISDPDKAPVLMSLIGTYTPGPVVRSYTGGRLGPYA